MSINAPVTVEDMFADRPKFPSVKFPSVGTNYKGMVLDQEVMQQREYNPDGIGEPKVWNDGKPMMQIVLTVQDAAGEVSKLYVKGRMMKVAKAAVRQAGLASFAPGTRIDVTHTGVASNRAKEYTFGVTKGDLPVSAVEHTSSVEEDRATLLAKQRLAEQERQAKVAAPVVEAPAAPGLTEEQTATLKAAGLI
jgi:hypothetical protein